MLNKRLWSNYLGRYFKVKITSRVLRTLDKVGGLDEYLVGSDTPARIKELGVIGWELRWRIMRTKAYQERVLAERRKLGLPERGWVIEEKERRRAEKREALMIAEAYLDAVKIERKAARQHGGVAGSVEEAVEQAAEDAVEELEASTAVSEQEQAEREAERELENEELEPEVNDVQEHLSTEAAVQHQNITEPHDETIASVTTEQAENLLPSQQLYAQLLTVATAINSHPNSLVKQARDLIANRTAQTSITHAEKARLATERAALVSSIDSALTASPEKRGDILTLYSEQIARAREEVVLQRERDGKNPLTPLQLKANVLGPPSNIPFKTWTALKARTLAIQREMPRRRKEREERHAMNVARKKYWEEHREEFEAVKQRKWRRLGVLRRARYSVSRMVQNQQREGWLRWIGGLVGVGKGTTAVKGGKAGEEGVVG